MGESSEDIISIKARLQSMEALLEQEKEKLNILVEVSGDTLFEYDIEKDCMTFTKHMVGSEHQKIEIPSYSVDVVNTDIIPKEDKDVFHQFILDLKAGKERINAEFRNLTEDHKYHWFNMNGKTLFSTEGVPIRVVGRANDIDDRKAREDELRRTSERDSLTGLYNHQVILDKISRRIKQKTYQFSDWLIIIDIDNFKRINDYNGHLVGDAVLCMVADELKVALQGNLLGRIGGDEFIAYTEHLEREGLEQRLRLLNSTIQGVYKDKNQNLTVTLSIGVIECNGINRDFTDLFQCADYALYKVKRNGKHGFHVMTAQYALNTPEIGYLNRETEEYVREETAIHNTDELVMFALELLDNVSDEESGLKMVSDRICSFYHIDDIAYVAQEDNNINIRYHWNRKTKKIIVVENKFEKGTGWEQVWSNFDKKGTEIIRNSQVENLSIPECESLFLVRPERTYGNHEVIVFCDAKRDRDWEAEKDGLYRMASILFTHLKLLYANEKEKSEIDYRINYDSVTGLPQYHKFIVMAEQYIRENRDKKYFYAYSDFTNFQYVNEIYGYTEGDKILRAFGDHLRKQPDGIYFSRVNSDYFVALLSGDDAEDMRQKYLTATEEFCKIMNNIYDQSNMVIISGLSEVTNSEEAPSWAIDRANIARKFNKNVASTVVSVYNQAIKEQDEAEKAITANMATALENGEFHAWLQPKVSLTTGKIVGAEALVRWQKTNGKVMYPDDFIPVFEKNGFITQVDFAVFDQVLDYLRDAIHNNECIVPISVNFSRRHNEMSGFVDRILNSLYKKQIPSDLIEAEITESMFMMDLSKLKGNLKTLKRGGISISIDDFGSGYSSLNVLSNVDADIIKLDKKFLNSATSDDKAPVFIKYLVKMIKSMGFQVLAEGVETKEQLKLLTDAECDMVQGYYYAKPMPIKAFRTYLKEFNAGT